MIFKKFKNDYCLEFDFHKTIYGYNYFIKVIDKKTNKEVERLNIDYTAHEFKKLFSSNNFNDPIILEKIKMGLLKGVLHLNMISYSGENLEELFCS